MAIYRGPYYAASSCTGSARPGAKELMSWYLGAYEARGGANLGIYNCKSLGSGVSIHGQGRACDLGTSPYNRPGAGWNAWGWALANAFLSNSAELGIQLIIFNRKVWSCREPDSGWRNYSGSNPHDGHMHVELIPSAAATLTVERIESVLGGTSAPAKPAPKPTTPKPSTPKPSTNSIEEAIMSLPEVKRGSKGRAVRTAQAQCIVWGGEARKKIERSGGVDGNFGPGTEDAVKIVQRACGLKDDGWVGPKTWPRLIKG